MTKHELDRYIADLRTRAPARQHAVLRQPGWQRPPKYFDGVIALEASKKALKVRFKRGAAAWIPFSAIPAESRVRKPGDRGLLAVAGWLADRFRYLD
jgi:hypothetical protein